MSDFDMPDYDDDDEDVTCAYCEAEVDFYCYQCSQPMCFEHAEPVALRTNYCTACMGKVIAKVEAADDDR